MYMDWMKSLQKEREKYKNQLPSQTDGQNLGIEGYNQRTKKYKIKGKSIILKHFRYKFYTINRKKMPIFFVALVLSN
jgi:hypothetical protein